MRSEWCTSPAGGLRWRNAISNTASGRLGVQHASAAYRRRLAQVGVTPSMSRKGKCYDNAAMESFWSTRKCGLIHRTHFATRAQARGAIFEWIEVFYNRTRLHGARGYQSSVDFENQLN